MKLKRSRLLPLAAVLAIGLGAYGIHSVLARQGQGALAQAPLNTQVQVPPAFIMALDDSGSMVWEALNNTRDGVYNWTRSLQSFFVDGEPRGYSDGDQRYYYVIPNYGRDGQAAIPPTDAFGFARSPDVNAGYFDPRVSYPGWKNGDGSSYLTVDPSDAPLDPRPAGTTGKTNATVDLTSEIADTANNWRFRVQQNMVLPAGLVVRNNSNCNATPNNINTGNDWFALPEDRKISSGSCDIGMQFFAPTFFLEDPATLPASYGYTASPVSVTDPPGGRPGTLYKYEIRPGNFASTAQYDEAIQNFAHWFTFYRTRREALVGGLTNALADFNNLRVGWFRINDPVNVTMRDMGVLTEKEALYNDIFAKTRASGSTPNRQAVRYLGEQFKRTGSNAPVQLTCQKNAGMLFTDGYINDGSSPNVGNLDGTLGAPFADGVSSTVADIVVPYYYQSLRSDIEANAVPTPSGCDSANPDPRLDCQKNLHMNFYAITLGTLGRMYGVSYVPNEHSPWITTPDPFIVPPVWHNSREDLTPNAVDELWHATINSRGEMINAKKPADIIEAIRRILITVSSGASPSGTIGLTGARIGTGSLSVEPFYEARNEGTDWYSTLTAYQLQVNPATRAVTSTVAWEASAKLPAHASRRIWFGTSAGASQLQSANVDFDALCNTSPLSRCNPAASYIGSGGGRLDVTIDEAVDYLRGDTSLEVRNGGKLRDRTTRLGDIVNSTPVISAPTDDYGYRSIGDATLRSTYQTYLTSKRDNRRTMVYAGANDGMLHAFDGGMGVSGVLDSTGGTERFAYVPQAVLGHMGNLLFPYDPLEAGNQRFDHRYYVDGPLAVSDAHYDSGWHTVLVGTMGAGGRGVFALDVGNASTGGTPFTSSDRLWEINASHATSRVAENIGHVLGRPVIVPHKTSAGTVSFKAIFGNGYKSQSGKAVLFVVDMGTGAVRMIEAVEAVTPPGGGENGLGNIIVLDRWGGAGLATSTRDGFADTAYGADQQGALWKFDLRTLPASAASPGTVTTPVFVTQTVTGPTGPSRQPILGGLTAAAGPGGGVMIYFGTGSFSFVNDQADTTMQTLYGVLDRGATTTLTAADLTQQTIVSDVGGLRQTSSNSMGTRQGWYMNLPAGERSVGYPRLESGILFVPTYRPQAGASGCSTAGFNFLFGLNALTGSAGLSHVRYDSPTGTSPGAGTGAIPLNTGGTAPVKDVVVMTTPRVSPLAAGSDPADLDDALAAGCSMVVRVAGAPPLYLPRACGRQSWRQIQ